MRYLNKIIFLNSAHIPYAEVKLDGNVHFIGTQGVGKSTLLRAILFFYNADKLKLGIPKEKKSFDAFYFPFANSYIIYEVMRENGAYCVVAAKSQGRVFFRFVDAPFQKEWFINERSEVHADWHYVRESMGKISIPRQVTSYEEYRDIIFGNNRKQELMPFRKFAIVESAKYQNIPRTIQNVFLNSKLEADFIKDTIIRSMSDEDISIDMDFYRGQIKEFEQEYRDVMLWFTVNKNGEVPVRKMAEKVMNSYRDLIYTRKQIDERRAELNYAEKQAFETIPLVKEEITKEEYERTRLLRLISELQEKYGKERDALNGETGAVNEFLKQVRSKRAHYEEVQIEEIIRRVAREENLMQEQEQIQGMKIELTKAFDDILGRYRLLFDKLEADFRSSENTRKAQMLVKQSEIASKQEELIQRLRAEEEQVRMVQDERIRTVDNRMQQLRDEQAQCQLRIQKISYERPYLKEMEDCEASISEWRKKDEELELAIRQQQLEAGRLRSEGEWKRKEMEWEFQTKMDAVRKDRAEIENKIRTLDALIEKRKGSLCEWLEQNKADWRETIGKVADEEQVLYNNELNPQLADGKENTLFGISLNLAAIDRSVRSPEEMKREREELQTVCQSHTECLNRLMEEIAEATTGLEKKYSKHIRGLSEKQHLMEAERLQIPAKLKNLQADNASWKTKEEEWKHSRTEELKTKLDETAHRIYEITEEKKKLLSERDKQLKTCQKSYNDAKTALHDEQERYGVEVRRDIERLKKQMLQWKSELKQVQENELNGKGADITTIRKYDRQLAEINKELEYINKYRSEALFYEKDKKEFLDKEPVARNRKKELETKLAALTERFAQRKEKHLSQVSETDDKLDKVKKELAALEEGLHKVDMFRKDETFSPPELTEIGEKPTRKSCNYLVEELKSLIISTIKKADEFKKVVTLFKGNFSSKNTFHFRTEFACEQDYCEFASNLCEFVDNDKISEYQKHISERYTDILRRISKEVGDLTRNESEINRTIKDINDDFNERNFAGVIKEIALRPLQSSDKLMQLLLEIKQFNDDNEFNMGQVDLFSQATREDVNATAVRHLLSFMRYLLDEPGRKRLALADTFKLEFRVKENDNDTGWVEKIANVGSDGTDILVKAMVNIMLINVFKEKASRKFGDFKIHCMMDEIGKLHPNNVKGILDFANCRNILLVNSSPTTYNVEDYRYTYLLSKDGRSNTQVVPLLTYNQNNT